MAKIPVAQSDGEIVFTPGGIKPARTYPVVKGVIEVEDEDLAEVAQALGAAPLVVAPSKASLAEAKAAAEQAEHDRVVAEQAAAENEVAVAEAAAAGAARAAKEIKQKSKPTG